MKIARPRNEELVAPLIYSKLCTRTRP